MRSSQGIFIVLTLSAISLISACGSCISDVCEDSLGCMECQQWHTGCNCSLSIIQRAYKYTPTANASGSTSIDVQWESKDGLPDSIQCYYGYEVRYKSDDKTTRKYVPHQANKKYHSITISRLQPATTYNFQVFLYRKQNNYTEVGAYGSNNVTATTLGSETTSSSETTHIPTETPTTTTTATTSTTTMPATTSTTSITTTTTPTTTTATTTTPTKTTTISPTTTSSTTPPETSSPTTSASSSAPRTATTAKNDQQKTIVALGVIIALLVSVIIVVLLVQFLQRRRINQQSKMVTTSTTQDSSDGTDYENVAMASSPVALTASDQVRSAGRADLNVPNQNDSIISSMNEADHSGKEQPYETLNNYEEVKGKYSRLNTTPTN